LELERALYALKKKKITFTNNKNQEEKIIFLSEIYKIRNFSMKSDVGFPLPSPRLDT